MDLEWVLLVESLHAELIESSKRTRHPNNSLRKRSTSDYFWPDKKNFRGSSEERSITDIQLVLKAPSKPPQSWITGLQLSSEKSQALHLRRSHFLKRPPIFRLNNKSIKSTSTLPYLGLLLNSTLYFLPYLRNKKEEINQII